MRTNEPALRSVLDMQVLENHFATQDGYHWYALTMLMEPLTIIVMLRDVVTGEAFYPLQSMATLMEYDSVELLMKSDEMQDAMLAYTENTGKPAIIYADRVAITAVPIPPLP